MLPSGWVTLDFATISALRPAIKFHLLFPWPAGVNDTSGAPVNGLSNASVTLVSSWVRLTFSVLDCQPVITSDLLPAVSVTSIW